MADYSNEGGESALMKASANGMTETVRYLVEAGAKTNGTDSFYQTALMWAAAQGHIDTVKALVECDAKVDAVTKSGKNAIMLAAQFGRTDVVDFLLDKVKKVEDKDEHGNTMLHCATEFGHAETVKVILAKAKDKLLPMNNKAGMHALMKACECQQIDVVKILINAGAPLDTQDMFGRTCQDLAESTMNGSLVTTIRKAMKGESV